MYYGTYFLNKYNKSIVAKLSGNKFSYLHVALNDVFWQMVETKFQIVVYIVRTTGTHNLATFHENVHTVNSVKCVSCKFFIRSTDFDKKHFIKKLILHWSQNLNQFFFDNFGQHKWTQKILIFKSICIHQKRLKAKCNSIFVIRSILQSFYQIMLT